MNIVFAYHNGDAELALLSAKAITAMGINMRHKATVCATNDTALTYEITEELKKSFPEVGRIFAQDGFNGWPLGPNQMFSDASTYCYRHQEPWYFWEPDCVPMGKGWVDDLEKEFKKEPNKIMGSIVGGGMASNGKNVYRLMVGSAVYPSKFLDYCGLAANLYNYNIAYRTSGVVPEPWDVRCRWVFLQHGRNTELIKSYWRSVNYQWKGGKIVFFAEDPEAQAIQGVTCPDRTVVSEALVVHGCKDGSLHRMAIAGFPMPEDKPLIPSDSTGLETPSNSMGLDELSGNTGQLEGEGQVVPDLVQIVNNDELKRTVKRNSPSKAKKRRNLSPEERKRRSDAMKAILARKAERKAQSIV